MGLCVWLGSVRVLVLVHLMVSEKRREERDGDKGLAMDSIIGARGVCD